ncbi:hypothetical protein BDP55DRAFT_27488 [Colletotrichum godetiae]|uniref:Uncharacterized protein n=1 Tax=Colletotrichum godetiae TaxID=1209918 RepID=A0AAJ0AQW7_9PEZI|nr:uncharacterized protein BDP55DRAFT_27488 [Colletotrichum godetiae]KAK1688713.1 hypothetical protein BDP55DRAFT_27488 [Colletotrichum godetiae]
MCLLANFQRLKGGSESSDDQMSKENEKDSRKRLSIVYGNFQNSISRPLPIPCWSRKFRHKIADKSYLPRAIGPSLQLHDGQLTLDTSREACLVLIARGEPLNRRAKIGQRLVCISADMNFFSRLRGSTWARTLESGPLTLSGCINYRMATVPSELTQWMRSDFSKKQAADIVRSCCDSALLILWKCGGHLDEIPRDSVAQSAGNANRAYRILQRAKPRRGADAQPLQIILSRILSVDRGQRGLPKKRWPAASAVAEAGKVGRGFGEETAGNGRHRYRVQLCRPSGGLWGAAT